MIVKKRIAWNKGLTKFPKLKCKLCDKEFQSNFSKRIYCSRKCRLKDNIGPTNGAFKTGRGLDGKGYRRLLISILSLVDQKLAKQMTQKVNNNWILEHRLVIAKRIGRPLKSDDIVHHIDGNPLNNHPNNLELLIHNNRNAHFPIICPKCSYQF